MDRDKVALITGGSGAIGKAIGLALAHKGFSVVLLGRNKKTAEEAIRSIQEASGNKNVRFECVDVSVPASIWDLTQRWEGPLDVLINNAAVAPSNRTQNHEGLEMQFATNVLGYFRMQMAFKPLLVQSAPARVVNVASYWAGDLDLNDLQFVKRNYSSHTAYRQSKQANRMLSRALALEWQDLGVTVNACHPGDVNSKLSNDLGFGGSQPPESGAETPVWLASTSEGEEGTGLYFELKNEVFCPFSENIEKVSVLLEHCRKFL